MVTRKDGLAVDHIPFPMPESRWILRQNWKKLTFLHWEVDPDILRHHLPDGLEIDLHHGKAYIGCIPFVMENVRPYPLPPVPGVSTFGEFNIRTYVTKNGVPGVFFLTLDAKSRVTCFYAKWKYGLAYRYAKAFVKGTLDQGYTWSPVVQEAALASKGLQRSVQNYGRLRKVHSNTSCSKDTACTPFTKADCITATPTIANGGMQMLLQRFSKIPSSKATTSGSRMLPNPN